MYTTISRGWLNASIKVAIVLLLMAMLYKQLFIDKDLVELKTTFLKDFVTSDFYILVLVAILMLANWGMEALKWQMLTRPVEPIHFLKSLKAVFCGVTFAIFTPNRIGEFGGRILVLENKNRIKGVVVTLVGSFAQIVATLVFGAFSLTYYLFVYEAIEMYIGMAVVFIAVLFVFFLLMLYYNVDLGYRIFRKLPFFTRFRKALKVLSVLSFFNAAALSRILLYSFLRYFIFAVQYLLLINMFGIHVPFFEGMIFIASIFLVQSVIPAPAVAELGVRNSVSGFFFSHVTSNLLGVYSAATLLWFINLIIPSLIGAIFILQLNILKSK